MRYGTMKMRRGGGRATAVGSFWFCDGSFGVYMSFFSVAAKKKKAKQQKEKRRQGKKTNLEKNYNLALKKNNKIKLEIKLDMDVCFFFLAVFLLLVPLSQSHNTMS